MGVDEDQGDYEMTLAGAEVWEHLYHSHVPHINLITRPASMCPVRCHMFLESVNVLCSCSMNSMSVVV